MESAICPALLTSSDTFLIHAYIPVPGITELNSAVLRFRDRGLPKTESEISLKSQTTSIDRGTPNFRLRTSIFVQLSDSAIVNLEN